MGRNEAAIEHYLVKRVGECKGFTRKVVYQGRTGSPDRWCFFPHGVLVLVECKAPNGRLEANQIAEITALRAQGFVVYIVSNAAEIDAMLEREGL